MLKIYNASAWQGEIILKDHIEFTNGIYNTGLHGYGEIYSGNTEVKIANYDFHRLIGFEEYVKSIKLSDGFVKDFILFHPLNYDLLAEKSNNVPKSEEAYSLFGLDEEAILLFTDWITLQANSGDKVKRIFGRHPETGLYLLNPDASLTMSIPNKPETKQEYEVLQSKTLGKRLVLNKMDRKI